MYAINMYFIFPPHLTCASALPGETGNKNCVFSLKCCMLIITNNTKHIKISLGYSWTTLYCQNDRLDAPNSTKDPVTHMIYVNQDCHGVGRCVKDGRCSWSSLSESKWAVLIGYLAIATNVHAIKHSTDDNFSFRKTAFCMQHSLIAAALSTNTPFE